VRERGRAPLCRGEVAAPASRRISERLRSAPAGRPRHSEFPVPGYYNKPSMTRAQKLAACGTLIAAYFFALTWRGLTAWFTGDDLANIQFLHGFGQRPFAMLLVHSAIVLTPEYRPLGGVVYRTLYAIFGLEPLPFRLFCYGCLLLNLCLAGKFIHLITESRTAAALGTLVFAVHTCMGGLYFNTGTLYDILCFTFGVSALIFYVGLRQRGEVPAGRSLAILLAFYCLALDCKEMAVTWPLMLLLYEAVFHWRARLWSARLTPIGISGIIALLYGLVKTQVPNEMSITPAYIPQVSLSFVAAEFNHYYAMLLWDRPVHTAPLLVSLAALLVLGVVLRSRAMVFGLLFANIALLPLSVIAGRSGFAWYIPYLGWALYAGGFLSRLIELMCGSVRSRWLRHEYLAGACFLFLLGCLYGGQRRAAAHMGDDMIAQENILQSMQDAMARATPKLPSGSRILLADDPFGPINWTFLFLERLAWHDATLWVDRPSQLGASFDPNDLSIYAAVMHAGAAPVRVSLGEPITQEPAATILISPVVDRSDAVSVAVEGFAGCGLDVEYRLPDDELARSGVWKNWCALDAAGKCRATINQDAERGMVQIRRIRLCGGRWHRANASFEILP
jgi:hypothetical protein